MRLATQMQTGSGPAQHSMRPWPGPQVPTRRHKRLPRGTQGLSLEKFTKVHHGIIKSRTRLSRCCRRSRHPRTARGRNPRQGLAGGKRQIHLGLSRRRRFAYLRRIFQARHHPARAGAPRAGGGARCRRLCARYRRRGRCARDLRPRRDQCSHRNRHRLHGQHSHGDHHRAGSYARHWP